MEKIARAMGFDPLAFRLKNALRAGELHPFSTAWSEGREPRPETIQTCGLEECVDQGRSGHWLGSEIWEPGLAPGAGQAAPAQGHWRGAGDAGHRHPLPGYGRGVSIKINDDGSFNLLVGATDLGTGSDTVLGQMAAEVLGVPLEDILVYSSDTDFTPFDKGAYASSTTYISGAAVVRAAEQVAERIRIRAAGACCQRLRGRATCDCAWQTARRSPPMAASVTLARWR